MKAMKKILLFFVFLVAMTIPSFAQGNGKERNHEEMRKEILDFKIKYLAQEMNLNAEQQKKFNTLYREMSNEKREIFQDVRALKKKVKDGATDEEYKAYSQASALAKEKEAELDRKYDAKFAEFMSQKQIYQMKAAEEQFRQKMHEMRGKKKGKK